MFDQTSYQTFSGTIIKFGPTEGEFADSIRTILRTLSKNTALIKASLLDMNAAVAESVSTVYNKLYSAHLVDPIHCSAHRWCHFEDGSPKEVWVVWTRVRKNRGKWYFGVAIQFECKRLPVDYSDALMKSKFIVRKIHEDHSMENTRVG